MRQRFLNWVISKQEAFLGAQLDHVRELARLSPMAFLKLSLMTPLARHRRRLQRTAYHLATLAVTRHEDCGTCVQIESNLARREGVPAHYIHAALTGTYEELPEILADVCRFASNIAQGWDCTDLRSKLRAHYGEEGMMELGIAISTARVYPTLKRALGFAESFASRAECQPAH